MHSTRFWVASELRHALRLDRCKVTPGFIETDLTRPMAAKRGKTPAEMGMKTPEQGAEAAVFLTLGR